MDSAKIATKYDFDFGKNNIPSSLFYSVDTEKEFGKMMRNNEYAFNIAVAETASHIVNLFACKGVIYYCFHSKESGETKYASVFVNDVYSLACSGNAFLCMKGDSLISWVESSRFVELQSIVKEIQNKPETLKKVLIKSLDPSSLSIFGSKVKDNLSQALESSDIKVSKKEIDFINSMDESDNPVIQIAVLKKF
jgi:hypothetical protein